LDPAQTTVTGIDYIEVGPLHDQLTVVFHKNPANLTVPPVNDIEIDQIKLYQQKESKEAVPLITSLQWPTLGGKRALRLLLDRAGGFTPYVLELDDPRFDPYFSKIAFSFKSSCPTDLDCKQDDPECPPEDQIDFPVDYQPRDFDSFRKALLDFAAQRYPRWQDRSFADFGVMFSEVLAHLGDEMAYYQDQVRRQAHLETATERRSLRRHARLVDTEINEGWAATAWIDVTCAAGQNGLINAGTDIWAQSDKGAVIHFEFGNGLRQILDNVTFAVSADRNSFEPHIWDEDDTCLKAGAVSCDVVGAQAANIPLDAIYEDGTAGRYMMLQTSPADASRPKRKHLVWVFKIEEQADPLLGTTVTTIAWRDENALPWNIDLTELEIRGNIVPATGGKTYPDSSNSTISKFVIGIAPDDPSLALPPVEHQHVVRAIEREGPGESPVYLFSLPGSEQTQLTWLHESANISTPEVMIREVEWDGASWVPSTVWTIVRSFTGPPGSSQPEDRHVTLEDGTWRTIMRFQRPGKIIEHQDYASQLGKTVRFGTGSLGRVPTKATFFEVMYRLGNGTATHVAANTLTNFDAGVLPFVESLTNPLAAENGANADTPMQIKLTAPEAFKGVTYRAVRSEDYAEAAERLDWVQKAGAPFRWTGSWSTGLATADPVDATVLDSYRKTELEGHLDRFRQAGHDIVVTEPRYVNLDLRIIFCAQPDAYRGEVKEALLDALVGPGGFFDEDNFSFGQPLYNSQMLAACQEVPGLMAVKSIMIKRLGHFDWREFTESYYETARDEIIRVENDPLFPLHGSVKVIGEGGA
jgi:hypothetical protein